MKLFSTISVFAALCAFALAAFGAGESSPESAEALQDKKADAAATGESAKTAALPTDVYPDSFGRLPLVKRDEMDDHGKTVYDLFVSPQARSLAGLQGPYGIWLHNPDLAERAQRLNYYLRYEIDLERKLGELAVLVTARELDNQFEWTAHEPAALKEGLDPGVIDAVRNRKNVAGLPEKEALIITFGRELLGKRKVSSATFAHAMKVFGEKGVVNLAALIGDYSSIAATINAFDIQLPPGTKPLLPMP